MSWSFPCALCGAQPGEPCINQRTGKPTKYEHDGQRYLRIESLTIDDLFKQELKP